MKRRIALITTAAAGLALAEATQAQSASGGKERVVIQVSTPEQRLWNQAMNYIENLRDIYSGNVEIEIVALGLGLGILKLESTQAPRVADALKLGGVHISACEVTMRRQKLSRDDMLPNIGYVPAGLGQIIKRQREGWAYISA